MARLQRGVQPKVFVRFVGSELKNRVHLSVCEARRRELPIERTVEDSVTTSGDDISRFVDDHCANRNCPYDVRLPGQRENFGPRLWEFFKNAPSLTASFFPDISAQGAFWNTGAAESCIGWTPRCRTRAGWFW